MVEKPNSVQHHYLITDQPQFATNRLKILVAGSQGCGKTAFVKRLASASFNDVNNAPENPSRVAFQLSLPEGICLKVDLVDIATHQLHESVETVNIVRQSASATKERASASSRLSDFADASGAFVLYDTTSFESFNSISSIIDDLGHLISPDCEIFLIGCKADLTPLKQISYSEAEKFSFKTGLSLFETSSKTGLNCAAALNEMVDKVYEKREEAEAYVYESIEEAEPAEPYGLSTFFCQTWSCI